MTTWCEHLRRAGPAPCHAPSTTRSSAAPTAAAPTCATPTASCQRSSKTAPTSGSGPAAASQPPTPPLLLPLPPRPPRCLVACPPLRPAAPGRRQRAQQTTGRCWSVPCHLHAHRAATPGRSSTGSALLACALTGCWSLVACHGVQHPSPGISQHQLNPALRRRWKAHTLQARSIIS
jgi:hypothetical protein